MPENKELVPNEENKPEQVNSAEKRITEMVDLRRESWVPGEVKTWMRRLEEDPAMNQNNSGTKNNNDDMVLKTAAPAVAKITLPTNRTTFTDGFSKPMNQAWRWLSEFVLRVIKKNEGKVKFKEE